MILSKPFYQMFPIHSLNEGAQVKLEQSPVVLTLILVLLTFHI